MKSFRMLLYWLVTLAFLCVISLSTASAQDMDNTWWRLKARANGYSLDATGKIKKEKFVTTVYMHLLSNSSGGYDFKLFSKTAPGVWEPTYNDGLVCIGPNEDFIYDQHMTFEKSGGRFISLYQTSRFKIKRHASGAFKSGTFKSLGAEVYEGSLDGVNQFFGGSKITGVSIKSSQFPAVVDLLNFQKAKVVIGQADFNGQDRNQGGTADANTLSYPFGNPSVYNGVLYLPDYNNHRVLGFNEVPKTNNASADFVLGQPDFTTTIFGNAANQLSGPMTVKIHNGKMFVADFRNNRVLIWNSVPTTTGVPADVVVGQANFGESTPSCTQSGLYEPVSIHVIGNRLIVADSQNHRVLIWNSIPTANGAPADIVLGQPDFTTCTTSATAATSLWYPTDAWSDGDRLIVADPGNYRILIWNNYDWWTNQAPADIVLGQPDMISNASGVSDTKLHDPWSLTSNGVQLFVADTANHRVLIWDEIPTTNNAPADGVLGQKNFTNNAPNDTNQDGVSDGTPNGRTLYAPKGLYTYADKLFVMDASNNRALIFQEK